MYTEPEDPDNNPWDDAADTSKKNPKKKEEDTRNPWAQKDNSINFDPTKRKMKDDSPIDSMLKQFKQGNYDFKKAWGSEPQKKGRGSGGSSGGTNGGDQIIPPFKITPKGWTLLGSVGLAIWLSSGFFLVQETDLAVILRLGKLARTEGPGLRYRLPFPIEQEIIKNVCANNVMNSAGRLSTTRRSDEYDSTLVLTGDENIIHISYTVTWKIKDLPAYLFSVRNPDSTILDATESIIREVVGQTDALSALTEERIAISHKASEMLQKVLDGYNIGVQIVQVQLQKVEAPSQVIDAFNDMQASLTDGDGLRIKAEAYRSEIVPKARGDAAKIIQEAEGYAQAVISGAQGEADRFKFVYSEYAKNPDVSRKRLYIDAMEHIMRQTNKTIIDTNIATGVVPFMNIQSANGSAIQKKSTDREATGSSSGAPVSNTNKVDQTKGGF